MKSARNSLNSLRTAEILLLLVVALGIYARMSTIFEPWTGGHNGWGGAVYGNIARNYLKFGYGETMLGPVVNSGVTTPDKFEFYYHHPPLLVWLLSLNYRLLGIHEWSARLLPLFFSLLSLGVLYAFVRRHFAPVVARVALTFFAIMPIEIFYGMHVEVYGRLAEFFSILTVTGYLNWLQTRSRKDFFLCLMGTVLGCMTSWFACFLVPPILIHHHWACVRQDKTKFWRLWSLAAVPIAIFLLFLLHRHLLLAGGRTEVMGTLYEKLVRRASLPGQTTDMIGLARAVADFVLVQLKWLVKMYTLPLAFLAGMWLYLFGRNAAKVSPANPGWAAVLFFAGGLMHTAIFPNLTAIHDYLQFPYAPGIAIGAAIAVEQGYREVWERRGRGAAVFLLSCLMVVVVASAAFGTWWLHRWDHISMAYRLKHEGEVLALHTQPTDTLLLPNRDPFAILQLQYYSDRRLVPGIDTVERISARLTARRESCVFVCNRQESMKYEDLLQYLEARYPARRHDGSLFIAIQP